MAKAAISAVNFADAGTVTATSQELLMPSALLLQPDVERRWRSKSSSDSIVLDLGRLVAVDTFMLRGLTVSAAASIRVRLSSTDSSGAAGDIADSGVLVSGSANFDVAYGALVYLLSAPLSARFVRIDIIDPVATYIEAGRLFVGLRTVFTYNFGYGWQVQWVDRSTVQTSRGGQDQIWIDNKYRTLDINLKFVTTTQRYGIVETIDRANGRHIDILLILNTTSSNLARDSIFGLVSNLTPVIQPSPLFADDGPIYSKQYQIKERL